MVHLITANEVINIAFIGEEQMKSSNIKDSHIDIAEKKYIIPIIGKEMFDAILADKYADILALLKPPLAFFIRHIILPDLSLSVTNMGVFQNSTDYSQSVSNEQRRVILQRALDNGQTLLNNVKEYLDENYENYPEYIKKCKTLILGGIVL